MTAVEMSVRLKAKTMLVEEEDWTYYSDGDALNEYAGRTCYQSFDKPNPATAENRAYLANIIGQGHHSVLEHSVATFDVRGVSRSLLLELERHRHLSFSVVSQRYVAPDAHGLGYVEPPAFAHQRVLSGALAIHWRVCLDLYDRAYEVLRDAGRPVKEAREAARAFLPGSAETRFVVTGNLRAWRWVIEMRTAPGADAEIQRFATRVRELLVEHFPNSMQ